MYVWDEEQQMKVVLKDDNSDEHEDAITCFDILLAKGLYVTGDAGDGEGLVKVWNCKKQLIREVKFVEPINSVCFLNLEGDLLVGHSGNLSRLDASAYLDGRMVPVNNSPNYDERMKEFQREFQDIKRTSTPIDWKWFEKLSSKDTGKHEPLARLGGTVKDSGATLKEQQRKERLAQEEKEKQEEAAAKAGRKQAR